MIKVSTDQALDRWDTLPMDLREALYSEANSDFLWKTCSDEHVPNEKIYTAARVSGYVLMGFLHPEDVAAELQEVIGLDKRTASAIGDALNQRIFTPLRQQIDAVYAPLSKFETGTTALQPTPVGPKIISENFQAKPAAIPMPKSMMPATPIMPIMKPSAIPSAQLVPQPKPLQPPQPITSQTGTSIGMNATQFASAKPGSSPTPVVSAPADKGWSKQTPQGPVVKLGVITPSIPTPAPAAAGAGKTTQPATPAPATPQGTSTTVKTMSEFERLDLMKRGPGASTQPTAPSVPPPPAVPSVRQTPPASTPTPTPMPASAPKPPMPGPVMLHEIGTPGAMKQTPNFQLNTGMKDQFSNTPSVAAPAKPVVLEFAGPQKPPDIKTVHYSEYKGATPPTAPAPPMPIPPAASRNITEIKPPAPPPAPRSVPPPPMPPSPPPKSDGRVIVKDYR